MKKCESVKIGNTKEKKIMIMQTQSTQKIFPKLRVGVMRFITVANLSSVRRRKPPENGQHSHESSHVANMN